LEEIRVSTEAAMAASRRLMSFVRPRDRREHERVDLNGTLRAAESIIRASAGRDTTVRLNLARGPAPVRMAAGSIEQIMVNLAINAWDAMPEGGAFTVRTEAVGAGDPRAREFGAGPGEYVLLTVEDTGCGMSEDVRTRLFEPFFTTKAERGTGLGLAAVDGLVRGAGGRIRVASEPGRGARFRILLPLAEAAPTGE
jgi:signal transduction histidine kinase